MRTIVSVLIFLSFVLAMGCQGTEKVATKKKGIPVVNTRWGLKNLNGKSITTPENSKEIFIIFRLNTTRFDGFAGCNSIGGEYEVNIDGTIKLSKIMSTMMACDRLKIEQELAGVLESVDTYKIVNNELVLYVKGKAAATFYAVYLN